MGLRFLGFACLGLSATVVLIFLFISLLLPEVHLATLPWEKAFYLAVIGGILWLSEVSDRRLEQSRRREGAQVARKYGVPLGSEEIQGTVNEVLEQLDGDKKRKRGKKSS